MMCGHATLTKALSISIVLGAGGSVSSELQIVGGYVPQSHVSSTLHYSAEGGG